MPAKKPRSRRSRWLAGGLGPALDPRLQIVALVCLVLAAFTIRMYRLGELPDTVLGDEADNVQYAARILYGIAPPGGFFGVDWTPQPAFSVYKQALFIALFGFNVAAMRLPSALISALALIPFYFLLRRHLSFLAAFLATTLLATNVWYLNFSRSGWNNIDVCFYMLIAMLFLMLALDSLKLPEQEWRRTWIYFGAAGFSCALGLYAYPAGRAIPLAVAAFLPVALLLYAKHRRLLLRGYIVLIAVMMLVFAPEAIYAAGHWERFNGRTNVVLIFNHPDYAADPAGTLIRHVSRNLRSPWDGSVNNTPQYSPLGEPQLDRITGALALAGMVLTLAVGKLRRRGETWLWWFMLLAGWMLTQLLTAHTPNGARGIGYMPALIFFAAVALDTLIQALSTLAAARRWPPIAGTAAVGLVSVAVIVVGFANVAHYVQWQSEPKTRQQRYIYLTVEEFPRWAADIMQRAANGEGITNLGMWREAYPIADPSNPYGATP